MFPNPAAAVGTKGEAMGAALERAGAQGDEHHMYGGARSRGRVSPSPVLCIRR